ncbi:head-to-tail adaptor [Gordonia phage Pons]|uniref:Head-to-tail adaptor n=4 Tax=Ponsvirus TaxID=3044795 RepID=A0AAE8Y8Q9_9CAUD|nr:head-tail adaptor [Gordonia phage Pons]YP_010663071.1 head-tail adaptor [Gordonia phage Mayweather]YP_010663145.1 head-tail adaptor [Gordonia phage CherryonLim]YP_010663281.1 head-tail adaptor [Gordonia phage SheckWes]QDM56434.1 head-to-tail adaptor [Gordonia phage SheckWes]QDP45172.1 head-to-tail adaptor [Gordonia phage Mayweather]QFP95763.1 head-to-tail adaptor [Gordonia phage CherryonLim]UDL15169.1 head-to-tail adaptor [Gordonia phage Pons]
MEEAPITFADLQKFDDEITEGEAQDMIATAWARAKRAAPCLGDAEWPGTDAGADEDVEILKDTMRGAILRWADRGSGAVQARSAGDYGETIVTGDGNLYRPNEIRELQDLCKSYRRRGSATTILTGPYAAPAVQHADWCSMNFVAWPNPAPQFCDCGAILTGSGLPLYPDPNPGV